MAANDPPYAEKHVEFWDGHLRYHADACRPLIEAVQRSNLELHARVHGHYPGRPLPEGVLPQLLSAGFWSADRQQDWFLPRHRNEGIEITFVENGTLQFSVDDHVYDLEPNTLTVTRPWQAHQVGLSGMPPNKLIWLIIDVEVRRPNQEWSWPDWMLLDASLLEELTRYIRQNETPVWFSARGMRTCFVEIARAVQDPQPELMTYNLLKLRINELFLNLLSYYRKRNITLSAAYTSNLRAVEVFLNSLRDELSVPWTLDGMAERCGVGSTSLCSHCKELTNLTPLRYLKKLRIDRAKQLLSGSPQTISQNVSILDISLECGFSSPQYFAVQFRKETGLTPTQYQSHHRAKRS